MLGGPLDERNEEIRVVDSLAANVHGGNYLRLDAADQVALETCAGLGLAVWLVVVPSDKAVGREPRSVYGEICQLARAEMGG